MCYFFNKQAKTTNRKRNNQYTHTLVFPDFRVVSLDVLHKLNITIDKTNPESNTNVRFSSSKCRQTLDNAQNTDVETFVILLFYQ